jgi:hypothetical protein
MPLKKSYLRRAGIKGNYLPPVLAGITNQIYLEGLNLVKPELYYIEEEAKNIPENLIPQRLKNSTNFVYFVSTVGKVIDERIEYYLNNNKVLEGSLLDAWSSESIEFLNDSFDEILRNKNKNKTGTIRYSPGYGGFSIINNFHILEMLNVKTIKANENTGVLNPSKSTVCIIGWY